MKKYSLVSIAATAITLLVCLSAVLTQSAYLDQPASVAAQLHSILLNPFASQVIIPAVCTVLVTLTVTRKISLGLCSLLTLVNLCIWGSCRVAMHGNFFNVSAWFFNMQDLILRISPVWFAAIAVWGVVEKKRVVWAVSAVGLALIGFLLPAAATVLSGTQAALNALYTITGGSLVLITVLAVYDWLVKRKDQDISQKS